MYRNVLQKTLSVQLDERNNGKYRLFSLSFLCLKVFEKFKCLKKQKPCLAQRTLQQMSVSPGFSTMALQFITLPEQQVNIILKQAAAISFKVCNKKKYINLHKYNTNIHKHTCILIIITISNIQSFFFFLPLFQQLFCKNAVRELWTTTMIDQDKIGVKNVLLPFLLAGPPPKLRAILEE